MLKNKAIANQALFRQVNQNVKALFCVHNSIIIITF